MQGTFLPCKFHSECLPTNIAIIFNTTPRIRWDKFEYFTWRKNISDDKRRTQLSSLVSLSKLPRLYWKLPPKTNFSRFAVNHRECWLSCGIHKHMSIAQGFIFVWVSPSPYAMSCKTSSIGRCYLPFPSLRAPSFGSRLQLQRGPAR